MKFHTKIAVLLLLGASFGLSNVAQAKDSTKPIVIPIHNWSSQIVMAYVIGGIFESIGDNVQYVPADSQAVYESIRNGDVTIGLLTGNWVAGARIKLANAGLIDYFGGHATFGALGGFGDDAPTRAELAPVALRRYRETTGNEIAPGDAVIIGDTPSDVECALVNGLRAVGVATGPFERDELVAAGADVIVAGTSCLYCRDKPLPAALAPVTPPVMTLASRTKFSPAGPMAAM